MGDDLHSWAFDGLRQKAWHQSAVDYGSVVCEVCAASKESSVASASGVAWTVGDIVGCCADFQRGQPAFVTISFYLNGRYLGEAFRFEACAPVRGSVGTGLFPAVSMNEGEEMFINIGQAPFKYAPADLKTKCSSCDGKSDASASPVNVANSLFELYRNYSQIVDEPQHESTVGSTVDTVTVYGPVDLESSAYETSQALEALGLDYLKAELQRRSLKAGGTLKERADRLFAVRGLNEGQISTKLKQKSK